MIIKKMNIESIKQELKRSGDNIKKSEPFKCMILKNPLYLTFIYKDQDGVGNLKRCLTKYKQNISSCLEKIEVCKEMVKKSENVTLNKVNNEKDGFNILKIRSLEYEKQRVEELSKHIFDLIEIKSKP